MLLLCKTSAQGVEDLSEMVTQDIILVQHLISLIHRVKHGSLGRNTFFIDFSSFFKS